MSILQYVVENNVRLLLAVAADTDDTTLDFSDAVSPWNTFPSGGVSVLNKGVATLTDNPASPSKFEIVTYTGVSHPGGGITRLTGVTRGAEGTTPHNWSIGSVGFQAITRDGVSSTLVHLDVASTLVRLGGVATSACDYVGISGNRIAFRYANPVSGEFSVSQNFVTPNVPESMDTYCGEDIVLSTDKDGDTSAARDLVAGRVSRARTLFGIDQVFLNAANAENIDWNHGAVQRLKLTSPTSYALAFTAPSTVESAELVLVIRQPRGTYPATVSWDPEVRFNLGEDPPSFDMAEAELLSQYVDTVIRFRYVSGIYYAENLGRFGYFLE